MLSSTSAGHGLQVKIAIVPNQDAPLPCSHWQQNQLFGACELAQRTTMSTPMWVFLHASLLVLRTRAHLRFRSAEPTLIWNVVNFRHTERRFVEPIKYSQTFGGLTAHDLMPEGEHAHVGLGRGATY